MALCRAPLSYAGTGGALVRQAKFAADRAALVFLARAMVPCVAEWARGPGRRAVVTSVPLHPHKLRTRGIDQAAVLAELVARRLGLSFLPHGLRRTTDTLPQGDVRVVSRTRNVAGAFEVRRRGALDGRTVLLVDDVRTSGSTAGECARVLQRAGVRTVALLTAVQA
ncbi:MAG: ComF family protein [Planctomycetes bacterium]|nr:ComF family protein [Planctomycetota bacterium]MCB9869559.1 ComF family protein [Planctomycetota bacterium]